MLYYTATTEDFEVKGGKRDKEERVIDILTKQINAHYGLF